MKILMVAAEMAPLARTGGLADVLEVLPLELHNRGHEVSVVLPLYRSIQENRTLKIKSTGVTVPIQVGPKRVVANIFEYRPRGGPQIFFVSRDEYFDRSGLYGAEGRAYEDNSERFIFFSKAAVELARRVVPPADIIHAHDWPAALIPVFVKEQGLPFKTVLTIHNVAFQGAFWGIDFSLTNLPPDYFGPKGVEFHGQLNFLKGGILHADAITTVSGHYASDIQTPEFGSGLETVLRENARKLVGIENGADYNVWNPAADKLIPRKFRVGSMAGKRTCRDALLEQLKLDPNPSGPVFAMITRLVEQKGFDILLPLLDRLLADNVRLVILGGGDPNYETALAVAGKKHKRRFAFRAAADEALAHLVEAGADVTLIPSRIEPGGLSAMYSLKYGAIPVARASGGIFHIMEDYDPTNGRGHGFLFYDYSADALWDAIRRTRKAFTDSDLWQVLVERAMSCDFSWSRAAERYEQVYTSIRGREPAAAGAVSDLRK